MGGQPPILFWTYVRPMGNKAFTVIELLIMVGVMSAILLIALPMYAMRAKRPDRAQAKAQLYVIKDAEESHKLQYGLYTDDIKRLSNWRPVLGKYQFRIRTADSTQFVAQADGDLNNDKIYDDDTWTIDQGGTLKKVK